MYAPSFSISCFFHFNLFPSVCLFLAFPSHSYCFPHYPLYPQRSLKNTPTTASATSQRRRQNKKFINMSKFKLSALGWFHLWYFLKCRLYASIWWLFTFNFSLWAKILWEKVFASCTWVIALELKRTNFWIPLREKSRDQLVLLVDPWLLTLGYCCCLYG